AGETIDAGGAYLIPGLVNLHAHTAMAPLRGTAEDVSPESWFNEHIWIYEQNLTPEDVYWGTLLGALEMLSGGVTGVADHYFFMDKAFEAFRDSGMRANLAQAVFGFGEQKDALLEQAVGFARDYKNAEERITVSLGPHSPYLCPDDFLKKVVDHAGAIGVPVHIHVSETAKQVEQSLAEHGRTPVEALRDTGVLSGDAILAHAYHGTDSDLALIAESEAMVAHCPKTYMRFGDSTNFLPRALSSGVRVGLASDGAASNSTMNLFEVARDAALLAKTAAGDPQCARVNEVLPLLTGGGRMLGLPDHGEVRVGGPADLVLVRPDTPAMNPGFSPAADLLYSVSRANIDTVMVNGRVVVRHGRHVDIDEKEVFARNRELVERVATRNSDTPMQTFKG
ncbi:MAG: amidohydrolase family protein, partial [bacterium]